MMSLSVTGPKPSQPPIVKTCIAPNVLPEGHAARLIVFVTRYHLPVVALEPMSSAAWFDEAWWTAEVLSVQRTSTPAPVKVPDTR